MKSNWILKATDEQLRLIYHHDGDCPTNLQHLVEQEMIRRAIPVPKGLSKNGSIRVCHASDSELRNILDYDNEIPRNLLHLILHEAIDRGFYIGFITKVLQKIFPTLNMLKSFEDTYQVSKDDLMQIGYIGLFGAVRTFRSGKAGFNIVAFTPVYRAILDVLKKVKTQKRTGIVISLQEPILGGNEVLESILINPYQKSVETIVIHKLEWEQVLEWMNETEKQIFFLRQNGYIYREIGYIFGKSRAWVEKKLLETMKKIKVLTYLQRGTTFDDIILHLQLTPTEVKRYKKLTLSVS